MTNFKRKVVATKVLGIDVSTSDIAFSLLSIYDEGEYQGFSLELERSFKEKFIKDETLESKLTSLSEMIANHDWLIKEQIDLVLIERNLSANALGTFVAKGWYDLCGALFYEFNQQGAYVRYVPSATWKARLRKKFGFDNTGMKPAQKKFYNLKFVRDKWGVELTDNDKADAVLIAVGGYLYHRNKGAFKGAKNATKGAKNGKNKN